jgi:hypothetical protein
MLRAIEMKHAPPKALLDFLKPYDPAIRDLALMVRAVVLEEMAPCHESIYDAYSAVALGYGPTGRLRDGVCHVAVYTAHVNIGFNRGTEIGDPAGILQGSGKWTRHITIKTPADLAQQPIRQYLRRAREYSAALQPWPIGLKGVTTVVKAVYARKRRPAPSQRTAIAKKRVPR